MYVCCSVLNRKRPYGDSVRPYKVPLPKLFMCSKQTFRKRGKRREGRFHQIFFSPQFLPFSLPASKTGTITWTTPIFPGLIFFFSMFYKHQPKMRLPTAPLAVFSLLLAAVVVQQRTVAAALACGTGTYFDSTKQQCVGGVPPCGSGTAYDKEKGLCVVSSSSVPDDGTPKILTE